MVFIQDNEGILNAPLDKVWKLVKAHFTDASKIHVNAKDVKTEQLSETTFINTWLQEIEGQLIEFEMKATLFYPLGVAFEVLEGPFIGSKYFVYYVPIQDENNTTKVIAVGDFKSAYVDNDDKLKELVLNNFESVFAEDVTYLQNIQ